MRVSVLDQTKRCCPLGLDRVTTVKLSSQNFSQVVLFKLLLREFCWTFFVNGVRFNLRERHIFPQYIHEWAICAVMMFRESMTKNCCVVSRQQKIVFLWYNFMFKQINHIRTAVHGHPNCLWSVGCQIVSVLTRPVTSWWHQGGRRVF